MRLKIVFFMYYNIYIHMNEEGEGHMTRSGLVLFIIQSKGPDFADYYIHRNITIHNHKSPHHNDQIPSA
jgi:hypothetical protein